MKSLIYDVAPIPNVEELGKKNATRRMKKTLVHVVAKGELGKRMRI